MWIFHTYIFKYVGYITKKRVVRTKFGATFLIPITNRNMMLGASKPKRMSQILLYMYVVEGLILDNISIKGNLIIIKLTFEIF